AAVENQRRTSARTRGRHNRAGSVPGGRGRRADRGRRAPLQRGARAAHGRAHGAGGTGVGERSRILYGAMNLDIIARLVQILKDSPELGAIEVRRGWLGAWTTVRVSRAGHPTNTGGEHVVVTERAVAPTRAPVPVEAGSGKREAGGVAAAPTSP